MTARERALSTEEIDSLLVQVSAITAPELLAEMLAFTQRQLDAEERRFAMLNLKAQLLLGAAAAAASIGSSTAGGALLTNWDRVSGLYAGLLLLGVGALLGVAVMAAVIATKALRVRPSSEVSRNNVLAPPGATSTIVRYRQFMLVHLWEVHAGLRQRLDLMADEVVGAQQWFVASLVLTGLLSALIAALPLALKPTRIPPSAVACTLRDEVDITRSTSSSGLALMLESKLKGLVRSAS